MTSVPVVVFWLWFCIWANVTGWLLSVLHQLNAAGYAVSLLLFAAGLGVWLRNTGAARWPRLSAGRIHRRFCRLLPFVFALVTGLVFLGGLLYAPNNYDALTYRLPRLLHWLMAGHWFWIPTFNPRMNYSGVGWEWTALPFMALFHSDRAMFLINATGFLLMPGLIFSVFRRLGVARKVAWTWMWILPLAYGLVTQAGSVGNDLTGTVLCLLAVDFGLRARTSGRVGDVWLSLLAAALMTGVKLSNLPLALPCLVAVWPALIRAGRHWLAGLAVASVCVVVSGLPIMALNQLNTGSWTGDPHNHYKMEIKNPVAGVLGNSYLLAEASLEPPLLPDSHKVDHLFSRLVPGWLDTQFPRLRSNRFNEIPGEEGAGLGLSITLPLLMAVVFSFGTLLRGGSFIRFLLRLPLVAWAAGMATLFFMAKMGSEAGPRLMLPYYPLVLIPLLLLCSQSRLLAFRWWRGFLVLMALSVLPVLIVSIARPLWPAQTISSWLARAHSGNKMLQRLATTYATYAHRNDFLAPLRSALPDSANTIGFIAGSDDTDYSLWRPFGRRVVVYPRHDIQRFLKHPNVEWLVVKEKDWPQISSEPLAQWAREHHARIVDTVSVVELVSWGPEKWCLLHFEKPPPKGPRN